EEWSKRLAAVNVSKDDLNLLVANYLFTEGYLSAAENFSREAGLDTTRLGTAGGATYDLESIRNRMEIRRAVLKGEVETALEKVVDLDLEILDIDPSLHFHLLQQHLIELIRGQHIPEALAFAQNELAPLAEEHPKFLKELEKTMALLAFELPTLLPPMPATISSLLDPSQRLRTARELNAAILAAQGHAAEPKLPQLMTMMNWGEGLLLEKGVDWPKCESAATKTY
ncbi:lish motif-containing protein, partial [Rhodotorula toruloides]